MATKSVGSIARPYAKAAFEFALDKNQVQEWNTFLDILNHVISDDKIASTLQLPEYKDEKAVALLLKLTEGFLPANGENFLRVVAMNKRLLILPAVASQFGDLLSEHQKQLHIDITTAVKLSNDEQNSLNTALKQHFNKAISVSFDVDEAILGGVIVRTGGDHVIDGSLAHQVKQLTKTLLV